jgi:autotransporter translocation and assembly factor TamB
MKRMWRIIKWFSAGIFALFVLVIAAALLFTRTARFNDLLRVQIVSILAQTYRGEITIGSIEGSVWGSLTLRDIEVRHRGATIATVPQLRVGYELLPALRGEIVISDIHVVHPVVHLALDPDGQWNLLAAIAERHASPPSNVTVAVALRRFSLEHAGATIAPAPSLTYTVTDANVLGHGHLGLLGETFTLETISLALSGPRILPVKAQGSVEYHEAAQVATIKVPAFSVATARSRIDLSGSLRDLSEKNVNATVDLRKVAAADVNSIVPGINLLADTTGTIRVSGNASDLRAAMALAAAGATIKATVRADITKSQPVWKLDSQLAGVELHKIIRRKDPQQLPAGRIDATVHASGTGFSPAAVKSAVDARVAGFAARGYRLGDLTVNAAADHMVANLKAQLAGPGGRARLAARVSLAQVPAYNVAVTFDHLRPAAIVKAGKIPPADLNLTANIDGSGYDPNTMRLRAQVKLAPSTVRAIRIDSGGLDAQLASGVIRIALASFKAGDTSADLNGQLGIDPRRGGQLNYELTSGQISPWLRMVGRRGSGRIDLTGQARGNLKVLHTTGSARFTALHVDTFSVAQARLTYDVGGLGTPLKPAGQIMLTASDLHTGIALKSLQTGVRLTPGTAIGAAVNVSAEDRQSHPATMRADITYRPGLTMVNLTRISVATPRGTWQLEAPAQITQRGATIEIRRFAATHQGQFVGIDGKVSIAAAQNLTLRMQRLRLADFAGFAPGNVAITGLASAELNVRGTAAAPVIAASGNLAQLQLANFPQAGMSFRLAYSSGRAHAEATVAQDATHSLTADGTLPLVLSWAHGFQARPNGDIDLRAHSNGLDLAVLNTIRNPQVSNIGGLLSVDLAARGPLAHPQPTGYIRVSGARASVPQTKVNVTAGTADIELAPGQVRLATLSAKAGDGTMSGSGALTLKPNGAPDRLDVRITLDKWPAIDTHEYKATIASDIETTGPLTAMHVGGNIEVLYGVFRPDLSVTGSAPHADKTIVVVNQWGVNPQPPPPPVEPAVAPGPTYRNIAIDMTVVIDRNTWIKTPDFAVELQGRLHVHKKLGGEPSIYGTINTVRGTVVVASNQFDLTRGEINFIGGQEINPQLMIVAQRRVQTYTVSVTVSGTANKPTITLSSIPDLPQADILSVMMFGKTTNNLSGGQQKDLQNQAASMAGGYAASQIGAAVAKSLGLENLGVTTNSAGVGLGRYLTKNVYVSATQSSSDMRDRRAQIQYYIRPDVSVSTSASSEYGNQIELQWHKDY